MKALQAVLIGTTVLTLAACGGGGNDSPSTQSTPTTDPTCHTGCTVVEDNPHNPTSENPFSGFYKSYDFKNDQEKGDNITTNDMNVLSVDGKKITLVPAGFSAGKIFSQQSATEAKIVGTNLQYARHGLYGTIDNGDLNYIAAFYQGQATLEKDIPISGSATYSGVSTYYKYDNPKAQYGTSTFNVDFANKNINGNVSGDFGTINLAGTISGNGFQHKEGDSTEMKGAFFGPKAEELAGGFLREKELDTGTFGAKKQ